MYILRRLIPNQTEICSAWQEKVQVLPHWNCVCGDSMGGRTGHSQTSPELPLQGNISDLSKTSLATPSHQWLLQQPGVLSSWIRYLGFQYFLNNVHIHPNPSSGHSPNPTVACSHLFCVLCHISSSWSREGDLLHPIPVVCCYSWPLLAFTPEQNVIHPWSSTNTHLLAYHIPAK